MTKEIILDQFRDINEAYNNSAMLDNLSGMIDKLLETQREEIGDIEDFREFAYQKHFDRRISAEMLAGINLVIDLYTARKARKEGNPRCYACGKPLRKDWNWCPWCRWETRRDGSEAGQKDDTIPRFDDSIGRMPEL